MSISFEIKLIVSNSRMVFCIIDNLCTFGWCNLSTNSSSLTWLSNNKTFWIQQNLGTCLLCLWWLQLWKFVKQNDMWYFLPFQKNSPLSISWLLGRTSLSFILASLIEILLFIHVYQILLFGLDIPLPIVPQCFCVILTSFIIFPTQFGIFVVFS